MRKRSLITASLWVLCLGFLLSTVPIIGRTRVEIPFTNPSGYSGNVVLSFPERVFAGDRTRISATISQLDVENLLDIVRLTGRLEAGFDEIEPGGEVEVNLQPGSPIRFSWKVRTAKNSTYPGNLWLWLEADGSRDLVLAKELTLESRYYLGRPVKVFRGLFALLLVVSGFVFLFDLHRKNQFSSNK